MVLVASLVVLHKLVWAQAQLAVALALHSCCSAASASAWVSVLAAWPAHMLQLVAHSDSPPAERLPHASR